MARSKFVNPLFQPTEKQTPDAARPLSGSQPPAYGGEAAAPQTAPLSPSRRSEPVGRRRPQTSAMEAPAEAPVKFTFYFSPEQLRQLDTLWVRAKLDHNVKVNKSEFVRLALDRLLAEFEKHPQRVLDDLRRLRL